MNLVIIIIDTIVDILSILIFIYTLLGYFLRPYHPVRQAIGRFVEPLLNPIRKVVPPIGGLDFSPLILILLIQVVGWILTGIFRNLI
jgi:YggT family protein